MYFSPSTGGFYEPAIHGIAIPADAVEITAERHAELLALQSQGKVIAADSNGDPQAIDPPPPSEAELQAIYTAAIQQHLDAFAATRGYDGILSACTYAGSSVAQFAAEGQYCVAARDATWAAGYTILADVQSGARPLPAIDAMLAELPALAWPA